MANKISVLIDVATDKAVSGLKGFKASINDADGAVGKMKAGTGAAFDSIKAHAGQLALAGGAALVGFGVKAVAAFQDTALAAGKMADSSGLAVDEASRWIAVGDDIGVSAETMSKGFNKLNIETAKANPLLAELGITQQRNAAGQVDANKTMLHAIDVIKGIQDPTKKAQAAQAAFGKGWMEMGELINMGSTEIAAGMAKVSDAQVIDDKELAKARKFRDALDSLQDKFKDIATEVGEKLVPVLSDVGPMLETIGDGIVIVASATGKFTGALSDVNEAAYDLGAGLGRVIHGTDETVENLHDAEQAARDMFDGLASGITTLDGFIAVLDENNVQYTERALLINEFIEQHPKESAAYKEKAAVVGMYVEMQEGLKGALEDTGEATEDLARENDLLADAIQRTQDRYADLKGELSDEEAFHTAEGMWTDLKQSAIDAYTAAGENADDAAAKAYDHAGAVIAAKQQVVELGEKYADLPEEEITRIVAMIDEGQLAEAERRFNILARNREMRISVIASGASGNFNIPVHGSISMGATGGIVTQPTLAVIGEAGPEAVVPLNRTPGSSPLPAMNGGTAPINVTVNAGLGANGREIADVIVGELKKYTRRNGPGWMG